MGQSHSAAQAFAQHTAKKALARDADCFLASSVYSIYESALEVVEEVEEVSAVEEGRGGGTVPLNLKHRADLLARALVKRFHRPRPLHSKPPILITRPIIWESGIGASDLNAANFSITWERGGQSDER